MISRNPFLVNQWTVKTRHPDGTEFDHTITAKDLESAKSEAMRLVNKDPKAIGAMIFCDGVAIGFI